MERYALLRHLQQQRQLVRRVLPDQRLGAYVAQHRLLSATIGALPEPAASVAQSWPVISDQSTHAVQPEEDTLFAPAEIQPARAPLPVQKARQSSDDKKPAPLHAPTLNTHELEAKEPLMAHIEDDEVKQDTRAQEQPRVEFAQPTDEPSEPKLAKTRTVEPPHAAEQQHEQFAEQQSKPNTRRSRIEERPQSSSRPDLLHPLNAQSEARKQNETTRSSAQVNPQAVEQSRAESEAAALFTSTTERSPQEWFALLMQGERKQQANERAQVASHPDAELPAPQLVNARRAEPGTRMSQPVSATRPVVYPSNTRSSEQTKAETRERIAPLALPASLSESKGASQFVPARLSKREPGRENTSDVIANAQQGSDIEPISLRAREVLKPLVGFDPAEARIHRGPAAARFANMHQADAVTVSNDIYLAAEHTQSEPETLGLLAHELTHVARHYEPRAIPPVLSNSQKAQDATPAGHDEASGTADEMLATADEETLAEQVEQQVTRLVREARTTNERTTGLTSATPTIAAQPAQADQPQQLALEQYSWGKLPAPWEPLPDWLSTSARTSEEFTHPAQARQTQPAQQLSSTQRSNQQQQQHGTGTPAATASATAAGGQDAPVAQNASKERQHATNYEQFPWQAPPAQQHEPEPDLDKLARQVYAVLKRKLEVDRRRMS